MKPAKLARSISMVDGKIQNENLYANITRTHSDTSLSVRSFHGYAGELSAHHKKVLLQNHYLVMFFNFLIF